ncbi:ribbon-helix-helix domain-containing protein [Lyngbya aestuarii]|uniref:ribbon-helix-helix domain-containing protein n=1 Tax=Lyngbya aestuarii TaxID=118322 RepID=UPI00403D713D
MAKVVISVFIEEEVRKGLRQLAESEERSLSQKAAMILKEAVERAREKGKLPSEES